MNQGSLLQPVCIWVLWLFANNYGILNESCTAITTLFDPRLQSSLSLPFLLSKALFAFYESDGLVTSVFALWIDYKWITCK